MGPALAGVFVAKLENGALQKPIGKLYAYCRYVDYNVRIETPVGNVNQAQCA